MQTFQGMEYLARICDFLNGLERYPVLKLMGTTANSRLAIVELPEGDGVCYMTTNQKSGLVVKEALTDLKWVCGVPSLRSCSIGRFHAIQTLIYEGNGVPLDECMQYFTLKTARLVLTECALILNQIHQKGWTYGHVGLDGFFIDSSLSLTLVRWNSAQRLSHDLDAIQDISDYGRMARKILEMATPRSNDVPEMHKISSRYGREMIAYTTKAASMRDVLQLKYFRSISFTPQK